MARPEAGGEHDGLGLDLALIRHHAARALAVGQDRSHLDVFMDAGAAHLRALDQRHCGVDRIGLAVIGQEHAADEIADIEQRPFLADVVRADLLHFEAEGLGHRGAATQLLEAGGVGRHRHAAALQEARGLSGLGFQPLVEVGRILRELGEIGGGAQLSDQPGRVPGGAAGEALALDQHDVALAQQRQMIGDRGADDAAAHDDDFGLRGQGLRHWRGFPLTAPDAEAEYCRCKGRVRRRQRRKTRFARAEIAMPSPTA